VLLRGLLDLLLPARCVLCDRRRPAALEGQPSCLACDVSLPRLPRDGCRVCQGPRPLHAGCCAACAREGGPLDACVAAMSFTGVVAETLRTYKYGEPLFGPDPATAARVEYLAREAAARSLAFGPPACVVPVPAHPRRFRERAFHPATAIARTIARHARVRIETRTLLRGRDTPSQTGLDRAGRRANVADAFVLRGDPPRGRVWLVDDVVTTGATLGEAARRLRAGGAGPIVGVCVARTPWARPH